MGMAPCTGLALVSTPSWYICLHFGVAPPPAEGYVSNPSAGVEMSPVGHSKVTLVLAISPGDILATLWSFRSRSSLMMCLSRFGDDPDRSRSAAKVSGMTGFWI